ncbi:9676_t:CDS:2, partial [Gigaspora margarita]
NKEWIDEPEMENQIKARLYSENTDLAVIPGSLTSIYQLLDVCINKPFKNKLRNYWHKWMANDGNGLAKGGNLRCANLNTVSYWVLNAWNAISSDIIVRELKNMVSPIACQEIRII